MQKNKFSLNLAQNEGGAIKWIGNQPKIEQTNIYQLNNAIYGLEIGSYPVKLGLEIYEKNNTTSKTLLYTSITSSKPGKLLNVTVGSKIQYILSFSVLDTYGKIVNSVSGYY